MTPTPPPLPAPVDPQAAGLLSVERLARIAEIPSELMQAQIALVCSSERYDLNRALATASLSAQYAIEQLLQERASLAGQLETLEARRQYGSDIINDMTQEAYDYRDQVAAALRLLLTDPVVLSLDPADQVRARLRNTQVHNAARALGLTL